MRRDTNTDKMSSGVIGRIFMIVIFIVHTNSEKKIWNLPFYEILHNIFRYILAAEIYAILKPWNLDILKY